MGRTMDVHDYRLGKTDKAKQGNYIHMEHMEKNKPSYIGRTQTYNELHTGEIVY